MSINKKILAIFIAATLGILTCSAPSNQPNQGGGGTLHNQAGQAGSNLGGTPVTGGTLSSGGNAGAQNTGNVQNLSGNSGALNTGGRTSVFDTGGTAGASSGGSEAVGGGTIDVGSGGLGGTVDVGSGGIGGTVDVGSGGTVDVTSGGTVDVGSGGTIDTNTGGTIDTNTGGTIDTGTGGSIDTGTGGTIDTCVPTCVPDLLGSGEEAVNLLVFEDANAGSCDTEGRMWVGGDATLGAYAVGNQLSSCDAEVPVLVVGGDLTMGGQANGLIWVGGEFISGNPKCGGVLSDPPAPVDFPLVQETLTAYSQLLSSYPANGTVTNLWGLVFSGTDENTNVFSIDGADLLASNGITISVPLSSTVIINVSGISGGIVQGSTTLPDGVVCGSGSVQLDDFCNKLIWNFYEAQTVTIGSHAVQGSVLAPFAVLTNSGSGQINGTVIVNSLNITDCIEMHPHYFNGCLCLGGELACCL